MKYIAEPLINRLKYRVPLVLSGFDPLYSEKKPISPDSHVQLQINNKSYQENYYLFKEKVTNSIGKSFLPIYRLADGEFNFLNKLYNDGFINKVMDSLKRERYKTCWGETYTKKEIQEAKNQYIEQIIRISKSGLLALHFITLANSDHEYYKLIKKTCQVFDVKKVHINENNYTSFYYVYALLLGAEKRIVLQNRNILIITSYTEEKKIKISETLAKENIKSIQFYNISPNKSMFEKLDLNKVKGNIDIVLIGAGIGSSNILVQCAPLNTVCIDAGIVLERYANPKIARTRIFIP